MGWRERDYAKWTDEERRRFLGSHAPAREPQPSSRVATTRPNGSVFRAGAGLAIAVSATVLVLGQVPRGHPLLPAFHFTVPSLHRVTHKPQATPSIVRITLPRSAATGSFLTLHGTLPAEESGTVSVEGAYRRPPWRLLAAVPANDGSYTARVPLNHKGLLHLRVLYPDGHRTIGSIRVR